MGGLYDKLLNPVLRGALKGLIHIVYDLSIPCLYMVDDSLSSKSPSYRPVGISCRNGLLDTANILGTAVIEGSSEAYHQDLLITDIVGVGRIIL